MPGEAAFERALEALAHRERTSAELVAWLGERGFAAAEIEDAVERLIAAGALDDERFAARFAEDKRELAGWGPERIRRGAGRARSRPGADRRPRWPGTVARISSSGRSSCSTARRAPADDAVSRARALAYLARRGYDSELAYEAVRALRARAA